MNTKTETSKALSELVSKLTAEQAQAYEAQTDKLIWIETTLLDPADLPRRFAVQVEDALLAMLGDFDAKDRGYVAFLNDIHISQPTFDVVRNAKAHQDWRSGWLAAAFENGWTWDEIDVWGRNVARSQA